MTEEAPRARPILAMSIAVLGLTGCALGFAMAPHDQLSDPLTLALASCVITSAFVLIEMEGSVFWGGTLIPHICAYSLLGPAPAAVLSLVEEGALWSKDRYRLRVVPINLVATVGPNMLAAVAVDELIGARQGFLLYGGIALVAIITVALNVVTVTTLVGLLDGDRALRRLRTDFTFAPALLIPIAVAVGAVGLYRSEGLGATAFVLAGVLSFGYVARRVQAEREQKARISDLAKGRGQLVAQVLETEDRERRALAESLHDDVVQTLLVVRQDLAETEPAGGIADAVGRLDAALDQLRGAIKSTHPSILDHVGLEIALTTLTETWTSRTRVRVHLELAVEAVGFHDRLLFSLVRELLANVAKHSAAKLVVIRLSRRHQEIELVVTDDGIGFSNWPPTDALERGHIGLQVAIERAEGIGGSLRIEDARPKGARIVVTLPVVPPPHLSSSDAVLASVSKNE